MNHGRAEKIIPVIEIVVHDDGWIHNNPTLNRCLHLSGRDCRLSPELRNRTLETRQTANQSVSISVFGNLSQLILNHFVATGLRHPFVFEGIESLAPVIEKALLPCERQL